MQNDAKSKGPEAEQRDDFANHDMASMLDWITGNGQEHRAYLAIEKGNYEEARRLLEPVAARGSEYSLLTLGGFYEAGRLGAPNNDAAIAYYERAANLGSVEAYRRLGRLLYDLGEQERARAAFQRGAKADNVSCMYWVGKMKLDGEGGNREVERGLELLQAASARGHFFAKRKLLGREFAAGSIFIKLLTIGRIIALGPAVAKEVWKDPDSDKLR